MGLFRARFSFNSGNESIHAWQNFILCPKRNSSVPAGLCSCLRFSINFPLDIQSSRELLRSPVKDCLMQISEVIFE